MQVENTINSAVNKIDPQHYRRALGQFASGVTIITTRVGDDVHGMTANAFMSGSLEPPLIVVSVNRRGRMCTSIEASGQFGVSVLCREHEAHSRHFGGQLQNDLSPTFRWIANIPVLADALTSIAAYVVAAHECGDHILFIGQAQALEVKEGDPLLFFKGRYSELTV